MFLKLEKIYLLDALSDMKYDSYMFLDQNFKLELKQKLDDIHSSVKSELFNIRSGKASPSLVENMIVEAYEGGTKLKLMELAAISIDGPAQLLISPFDPATIKPIEKAIINSQLGTMPRTDGTKIYIKFPPLSEEQRLKFIKIVTSKIEEGRVKIRSLRDDLRKRLKLSKEKSEITEDGKFRMEKELDTLIQVSQENLEELKSKKEKELMEV